MLTIEQAIEEIYEIYIKTGKMPNTASQERFSNGTIIGPWINQKNNQEKIKKIASEGNEKAKVIVDELKLDQEKIVLTAEQVVEEIYAIYLKTGKMPNSQCQERFSNGTTIGPWLFQNNNQELIVNLANQENAKAQEIVEKLNWNFTIEQVVEEIYTIYKQTGKMPNSNFREKFSNGTVIGTWINKKNNHVKIIELAQQGNEKARVIVEKSGWNFTIEQAIEEIYEIYLKTGKMPNTMSKERFSNGTTIGTWLTNKNNQAKIKELAQQGNEKAKIIYDFLDAKTNKVMLEQLCNEYNINYKKNKKYVDKLSFIIFNALLKYFVDNNINYIDSEGLLISDFYMSSKDFEMKYGISVINLISNQKIK